MGSRSRLAVLLVTITALGVACGCTEDAVVETPPAVTFDGSSWVVQRGTVDDEVFAPVEGQVPTFAVAGDRATGSTGCNSYTCTISTGANGLVDLRDFSVTEIGCEPAVMDVEAAMLAVLMSIDRFDLDGDRLTLSNGDGSAELVMTAVVGGTEG